LISHDDYVELRLVTKFDYRCSGQVKSVSEIKEELNIESRRNIREHIGRQKSKRKTSHQLNINKLAR